MSGTAANQVARQQKARLARTLYRQIVRWTNKREAIPIDPIPPVTLKPPLVDADALNDLAALASVGGGDSDGDTRPNAQRRARPAGGMLAQGGTSTDYSSWLGALRRRLPAETVVEPSRMVVPVADVTSLRELVRVVYRINDQPCSDEEAVKGRISLGFETVRSLNQLSPLLKTREEAREAHSDRTGVRFHVGQVVQHEKERWRGVISGWKRPDDGDEDEIVYSLIMDDGDAHVFGGSPRSWMEKKILSSAKEVYVSQSDLRTLDGIDAHRLARIRNPGSTRARFEKFDASACRFVPNERLAYEYPSDDGGPPLTSTSTPARDSSVADVRAIDRSVAEGVRAIAAHLRRVVVAGRSSDEAILTTEPLQSVLGQLSSVASGETGHDPFGRPSSASTAVAQLRSLGNVLHEVLEATASRAVASENSDRNRFSLGTIVRHKVYGFRGVVVAWDPKPTVNVAGWDGLQHIRNAGDQPFYHVIPDVQDCIDAFGSTRPFRYVCEENLELCPRGDSVIHVDLEDGWILDKSTWTYDAPKDIKFKYGESLGGEEASIAERMHNLAMEIANFQVAIQCNNFSGNDLPVEVRNLSLGSLFTLLQASENTEDARVVEETIKDIWKAHKDESLRARLDLGVSYLFGNRKDLALAELSDIVVDDPAYFEAWNKKATCHFLRDEIKLAMEATRKTLHLEPHHSQALSGFGLIHQEKNNFEVAIEYYRQSLDLNPWSPVSSRLLRCLELLDDSDVEEEGGAEGSAPLEDFGNRGG